MGFVIAVDGPAASGKGTIAARLAKIYGYPHLDTGLLYRAVGLELVKGGFDLDDATAAEAAAQVLTVDHLADPELRGAVAGEAASRVAVHPQVRRALIQFQQAFAEQDPGAVLDGRDIGTVIAPRAQAKLFVTASAEARAERRWKQLRQEDGELELSVVLSDILRRDARDAGRDAAPMVIAPDAVLLDTTDMDISAATDAARRIVEAARAPQT
ncbi:MAG TPA: (d)CMP kinase [Caulobacteraceae bacterium]|jgi:cytidylate kinase|nr:(d)CMP kinase [Caulobacteraceae bacterium]